jgi:hypothetical protein
MVVIADGLDIITAERMGSILFARGVPMSEFWAKRDELEAAWSEAVLAPSTLLTKPSADDAQPAA